MDSPLTGLSKEQLIKRCLDFVWDRLTCCLGMLAWWAVIWSDTHLGATWCSLVMETDGHHLCTLPLPCSSRQVPPFFLFFLAFKTLGFFLFSFFFIFSWQAPSLPYIPWPHSHQWAPSLHFPCAALQGTTISQRRVYTPFWCPGFCGCHQGAL